MATMITEGARKLRAYLLEIRQSVPEFCETHRIPRQKVQRALNGAWKSVTVDFAIAVSSATGGAVPFGAWSRTTLAPANPGEVGRLFSRRGRTVERAHSSAVPVPAPTPVPPPGRRRAPVRARPVEETRAAS